MCGLLCDIMHLEGAKTIAEYSSDFYEGTPAATSNSFGKGAFIMWEHSQSRQHLQES
jgi:beta-galactosidase GanA